MMFGRRGRSREALREYGRLQSSLALASLNEGRGRDPGDTKILMSTSS